MTGFALILWAYRDEGSAMTVSLMSFFNYMPYIIASFFAGAFVDNHNKKRIMIISDSTAALCSAVILILNAVGRLGIWHIYLTNAVIGFVNAFQGPAASVAVGRVIPKEKLSQISGMNSFSGNLVTVLSPVIASVLFAAGGVGLVLSVALASFLFAFAVLVFVLKITEDKSETTHRVGVFAGCVDGFRFLIKNKKLVSLFAAMAVLNFFSRLTYENILSPMILSRSGNDTSALGIVNAVIGIGGIVGGIIVSTGKIKGRNSEMIYISAAVSFLLGDVFMGAGRNVPTWAVAGFAASFPIAFINTGQMVIIYKNVPEQIQGRIFSARNAVQFGTIPCGILFGGILADYVFEPFMASDNPLAGFLQTLVGAGAGSGMAVMFLCTGIIGALFSLISYSREVARESDEEQKKS